MRPRSIITLSLTWLLLSLQPAPAQAEIIYALSYPFQGGRIASFDSNSPGALLSLQRVTGVVDNEQLEGIDIRPADGKLYAWGAGNKNLYTTIPLPGSPPSLLGSILSSSCQNSSLLARWTLIQYQIA
jgi:hypothetical protein